jgi:hypothetical protein
LRVFETIDVGQQNRVMEIRIAPSLDVAALEPVKEEAAIGQFGQGVVECIVSQVLLGIDPLRDVGVDEDQLLDLSAVVLDGAGRGFENAPGSIRVTQAILQAFPTPVAWASREASSTLKRSSGWICSNPEVSASSRRE